MAIRLKLKEALEDGGVTVYRLGEVSGVPRNTLYNLANQERERLDLAVLDKVMTALEQLTGQRVALTDLLERDTQDGGATADESEYEFPDGVPDDIRERIEQFERGDKKGKSLEEIAAKHGVKR
jgi:transcriptional regulator with XRE-family HTH domain